jgi:demethylmenaquinone methyltransferase / 2-methoxy-6-polyprenyl-1,4-benzoquinol methylase
LGKACARTVVVGADFCFPMLKVAQGKAIPHLVQADGLYLPFRDASFDALTVAFGLRNMADWAKALREMARVLRPGGILLVMDFSLPEPGLWRTIYRWYLHNVLPRFAAAITGNKQAYEYLAGSIEAFPSGRAMQKLAEASGFFDFRAQPLCGGVASIYTARSIPYK